MNKFAAATCAAALPLLLSSCVTYHTHDDGIARARIGEAIAVSSRMVMPLKVLEDSRCPRTVQCIQAGHVRVLVRIDGAADSDAMAITLGEPLDIPAGQLTMVEAYPERRKDTAIYPEEYRFGFTFQADKTGMNGK